MNIVKWLCLCLVVTLAAPNACGANVTLILSARDVRFVCVSPNAFGEYNVVLEIFGPSRLELARITGANIGQEIDVYTSDTLIGTYPITVGVDFGMIGVGRYGQIDQLLPGLPKSWQV